MTNEEGQEYLNETMPMRLEKVDAMAAREYSESREELVKALHDRAEAAEAENKRLRDALILAANRIQRLALECPLVSHIRFDANEWCKEARAAPAQS